MRRAWSVLVQLRSFLFKLFVSLLVPVYPSPARVPCPRFVWSMLMALLNRTENVVGLASDGYLWAKE